MTLFDLETFLKRGEYRLRLAFNGGKFRCGIVRESNPDDKVAVGTSSTLAQAIDNAMIELRTRGTAKKQTAPQQKTTPRFVSATCTVCNATWTGVTPTCTCGQWNAPAPSANPPDPNAAKKARALTTQQIYAKGSNISLGDVYQDVGGMYWEWTNAGWVRVL